MVAIAIARSIKMKRLLARANDVFHPAWAISYSSFFIDSESARSKSHFESIKIEPRIKFNKTNKTLIIMSAIKLKKSVAPVIKSQTEAAQANFVGIKIKIASDIKIAFGEILAKNFLIF